MPQMPRHRRRYAMDYLLAPGDDGAACRGACLPTQRRGVGDGVNRVKCVKEGASPRQPNWFHRCISRTAYTIGCRRLHDGLAVITVDCKNITIYWFCLPVAGCQFSCHLLTAKDKQT